MLRSFALSAPAALVLLGNVPAQCITTAEAIGGVGADAPVNVSLSWDPDGAGPALPVVVLGGSFSVIGDITARGIAAYEPVSRTWSTLGGGMTSTNGSVNVMALTVLPTGELVAGGLFTHAGAVATGNVATWNGTTWSPMGNVLGQVRALTVLQNGSLVAAAGACFAWNGTTWTHFGGIFNNHIWALAAMPNGDLVAGGVFSQVNGVAANSLARWDGTTWHSLGSGVNGPVTALLPLPNGDLVVAGGFLLAGGSVPGGVARWDGSTWSGYGSGFVNAVYSLAQLQNGDLVVGGAFGSAGGVAANNVARWNGTTWAPMGGGVGFQAGYVYALAALPGGDVLASGSFLATTQQPMRGVARWNGTTWEAPSAVTNGTVAASVALAGGGAVIGGFFTVIDGVVAMNIARVDGTTWSPLGAGLNFAVNAVLELPNGDIVAGGEFTMAGTVPCQRIARWDGASWHPFGAGFNLPVYSLALSPAGEVVAGGAFAQRIARWDGASWVSLGVQPGNPRLTNAANGDLIAGGTGFAGSTDTVWRWDGTAWSPLAGLTVTPMAVQAMANGDVIVSNTNTLYRWNGASWAMLPFLAPAGATTIGMAELPDGDLLAGRVQRLDAGVWSTLTPVTAGTIYPVLAMAFTNDGQLLIGGTFTTIAGAPASGLARATATCNALATAVGTACSGSAGPSHLTATALPWLGALCETSATGMPANSLAIRVFGFSAVSVPLPNGLPGCSLFAAPDLLDLHLTVAGRCDTSFFVPPTASLVGQSLYQQMVPLELDALGTIVAITSTNALQLTIGVF